MFNHWKYTFENYIKMREIIYKFFLKLFYKVFKSLLKLLNLKEFSVKSVMEQKNEK